MLWMNNFSGFHWLVLTPFFREFDWARADVALFRCVQFSNIIHCVNDWPLATLDLLLFFQQLYYATFITHSTVFIVCIFCFRKPIRKQLTQNQLDKKYSRTRLEILNDEPSMKESIQIFILLFADRWLHMYCMFMASNVF